MGQPCPSGSVERFALARLPPLCSAQPQAPSNVRLRKSAHLIGHARFFRVDPRHRGQGLIASQQGQRGIHSPIHRPRPRPASRPPFNRPGKAAGRQNRPLPSYRRWANPRHTLVIRIGSSEGSPSEPERWVDPVKSHRRHTPASGLWDPAGSCAREISSLPADGATVCRGSRNRLDVPCGQALSGRCDRGA